MADLQWWCAARGVSWSWLWTAYPGVWLFVGLFATVYWRLARRELPGMLRATDGAAVSALQLRSRRQHLAAIAGILLLWLSLDWPVAALGAGYLSFVHSLQFVLLGMVVPGLLVYGISDATMQRISERPRLLAIIRGVTAPPAAAIIFTIVLLTSHAPVVLDALMASQAGNFALDMFWLAGGFILAWPLFAKEPTRPNFGPPLRILYVFLATIAHLFVGMWFLSARFPVYRTYELAPRMTGLDALTDQHLAGAVMLMVGTPIILLTMTVIFFRWQGTGAEESQQPPMESQRHH